MAATDSNHGAVWVARAVAEAHDRHGARRAERLVTPFVALVFARAGEHPRRADLVAHQVERVAEAGLGREAELAAEAHEGVVHPRLHLRRRLRWVDLMEQPGQ